MRVCVQYSDPGEVVGALIGVVVGLGAIAAGIRILMRYIAGSAIEGRDVTAGGLIVSFTGGALGAGGVGAIATIGRGFITSGQLAAVEVLWNAEIGLAEAAASVAFP